MKRLVQGDNRTQSFFCAHRSTTILFETDVPTAASNNSYFAAKTGVVGV